jgi:hypothetical protein
MRSAVPVNVSHGTKNGLPERIIEQITAQFPQWHIWRGRREDGSPGDLMATRRPLTITPEPGEARTSTFQHPASRERNMALLLIGGDDQSEGGGSPAVWVDTETREILVQGMTGDESTKAEARATGKPTPDHESIVRFPDRLFDLLAEAHRVIRDDLRGDDQPR